MSARPDEGRAAVALLRIALAACVLFCAALTPEAHAWGDIPARAWRYRPLVVSTARAEAGPDAPVALFAAQIAQESGWDAAAVSPVGALGLAQFMPSTANDLARRRPDMGPALPTNPTWAVRAMVAYDLQNKARLRAAGEFDLWAFTLMAYNGGLGWVFKDQRAARAHGLDPLRARDVSGVNAGRAASAKAENDAYWRRIMQRLMPVYEAAGWGRGVPDE